MMIQIFVAMLGAVYHFVHTILTIPVYRFVPYHFVRSPHIPDAMDASAVVVYIRHRDLRLSRH